MYQARAVINFRNCNNCDNAISKLPNYCSPTVTRLYMTVWSLLNRLEKAFEPGHNFGLHGQRWGSDPSVYYNDMLYTHCQVGLKRLNCNARTSKLRKVNLNCWWLEYTSRSLHSFLIAPNWRDKTGLRHAVHVGWLHVLANIIYNI